MRTFQMVRYEDTSGVSGVGVIAEGVVFTDGTVVLRWVTAHRSTGLYDSVESCLAVHGHFGRTRLVFEDGSELPRPDLRATLAERLAANGARR
ncbi:MAG TPA: hypothetical protein VF406_21240 [Thermodesulfobacteriota bacterium]